MSSRRDGPSEDFLAMRRRILSSRGARQRALVRRARACAGKIARLLKRKYGVGGVFLYGSLARGGFAEHSDLTFAT